MKADVAYRNTLNATLATSLVAALIASGDDAPNYPLTTLLYVLITAHVLVLIGGSAALAILSAGPDRQLAKLPRI